NYSEPELITHLNNNHQELNENNKEELIKDLKLSISRNKSKKKRLFQNQNTKKEKELYEFKMKVLKALIGLNIDDKKLEILKNSKNIKKLKRVLKYNLEKKFQIYLDKARIDYHVESKKKDRNLMEKEYFDKTENSIRVIYTPMGNKR